ncbi:arylamine N-acetyltransferase [uncultured Microbulbifer sp.]|uniref:arylamine N-acetyltransferase n=1 Tax=uncultured Microbulbifer sp. TaxID=348147 RepID=UPI0026306BEA|nr:arylamine N-acetyltransferase [uncultured Microbulbifer sp.]
MINRELSISEIEQMILDEFQATPFHNLFYLEWCIPSRALGGGTCSDKVLALRTRLQCANVSARLHNSWINDQLCHRVLALELDDGVYYADVGNGWPSFRLFPADREVRYKAFGIVFQTRLRNQFLDVYQIKEGRESLSQSIPKQKQRESAVISAINQRFNGEISYPFRAALRYAQVVDDDFLFLKGDELRIYSDRAITRRIQISNRTSQLSALQTYFGLDLEACGLSESKLRCGRGAWGCSS